MRRTPLTTPPRRRVFVARVPRRYNNDVEYETRMRFHRSTGSTRRSYNDDDDGDNNIVVRGRLSADADGPVRRAQCCTQRWTLRVTNWRRDARRHFSKPGRVLDNVPEGSSLHFGNTELLSNTLSEKPTASWHDLDPFIRFQYRTDRR